MTEVYQDTINGRVTMKADMRRRAVRLHHPNLRSCQFTFVDAGQRYPTPFLCPQCGFHHEFKTYHLTLNANGDVAIHADLYERLKAAGLLTDLKATKEVIPRPAAIGMPLLDARSEALPMGPPVTVVRQQPSVWQPPVVISREEGLIKAPGIERRNAVIPPPDRFVQMPDGTWEERKPDG